MVVCASVFPASTFSHDRHRLHIFSGLIIFDVIKVHTERFFFLIFYRKLKSEGLSHKMKLNFKKYEFILRMDCLTCTQFLLFTRQNHTIVVAIRARSTGHKPLRYFSTVELMSVRQISIA